MREALTSPGDSREFLESPTLWLRLEILFEKDFLFTDECLKAICASPRPNLYPDFRISRFSELLGESGEDSLTFRTTSEQFQVLKRLGFDLSRGASHLRGYLAEDPKTSLR